MVFNFTFINNSLALSKLLNFSRPELTNCLNRDQIYFTRLLQGQDGTVSIGVLCNLQSAECRRMLLVTVM